MESFSADITAATGFLADGGTCGLKASGRRDVGAVISVRPATAAGTFTANKVRAAPVLVCEEVLRRGATAQAIVFNSGNANASTGKHGIENARAMQRLLAGGPGKAHGIRPEQVFVASTGVIGVQLDMDKLTRGVEALTPSPEGGTRAVEAMMTTDTVPKTAAARFTAGGATITVAGMAKGAAMIAPQMVPHATMLAFVGTDAAVERAYLQRTLTAAVEDSFNMVIVDGDMSTNDTCLLLANGAAWAEDRAPLDGSQPECAEFEAAVRSVCARLAQAMARDGEGATKFIEVIVEGAANSADARRIARSIAGSNLTKSAVLGADPNWGRIAMAIGKCSEDADIDQRSVTIRIGGQELYPRPAGP
ncbi:MAG TPA: bifunctional glutamate N-acetyltransferase/amino-acid acetyltransferase ArgJ, partial [Chloroflexota bacterium]|nr:bifunctional glutamate N-acetyltransferase/amino-acid acetyltransferase ArgJ [Chloroflexota bacterium]